MAKVLDFAPVDAQLDRANFVPTNIMTGNLLSPTNHAYTCFVDQKFSNTLQAFMVNYVLSVSSFYPVYK